MSRAAVDGARVDVVVVGAGVVGCAAALALAKSGCDVLLADAQLPADAAPQADDEYDLRVYALAHGSRRLLTNLGVWPLLPHDRIAAYRSMRVWDEHGSGELDFDASLLGEESLGFIVEQRALLAALMARMRTSTRVDQRADTVASMESSQRDTEVRFAAGASLRTRLVVAADGANSTLREAAGIRVARDDYAQRAIVAHVRTERAHDGIARQRFAGTGPLALLPLADGRVSIVWSLPTDEATRILALHDDAFLDELTAASGGALGRCLSTTPRASFPLSRWQAQSFIGPRLALA
ncbi:MAG: FAD-dependent oxidoreductase, partial [Lysobacterales bacterium]